jgi:hypothetical protein
MNTQRKHLSGGRAVSLRRRLWLIAAGLMLAAATLMLPATAARAVGAFPTPPQVVSGPTPLALHNPAVPVEQQDPRWCGTERPFQGWETDNSLAVNPANPNILAVAWIQDFMDAIVVGRSTDGGETWEEKKSIPPTTPCTGGVTDFGTEPGKSANDPVLSFGPDGTAYLMSGVFGHGGLFPAGGSAAVINTSRDGGATWSQPFKLDIAANPLVIDTSNLIADPDRPGYAYAQWTRAELGLSPQGVIILAAHQYASHTTDGGSTWCGTPGPCVGNTPPVPIPSSQPERLNCCGHFLVLPNGTLLNILVEFPNRSVSQGPTSIVARRSTNLGATWSEPITIVENADPARVLVPAAALAPDRKTVYVSWQTCADAMGGTDSCSGLAVDSRFRVMFSKSTNGGLSWEAPAQVGEVAPTGPASLNSVGSLTGPALAVADDGTRDGIVGVAFYDHRDHDGTFLKTTHYWLRHSHDGGATWEEKRVAGPFNKTTAPLRFLGDYQGIAPLAGGFVTSFVLARPNGTANFQLADPEACAAQLAGPPARKAAGDCTDVFFSRLRLGLPDLQVTKISASDIKTIRAGDKVTLTATVSNLGAADAAASQTEFLLDGSRMPGGLVDTPLIGAGGSVPVTLSWDTRGLKGEHTLKVIADSGGSVDESSDTNNTRETTVIVRGNQVSNPSFEQSSNGSSPDSWSSSGSTAYENGGSDGSRSVSTGPGGSWTSDPVPVEEGSSYEASVAASGAGATLLVQQLAADGTVLAATAQPLLPTSLFTLTSLHLSAIAGAAQVRVVLIGGLTGKTTFDEVGLFSG